MSTATTDKTLIQGIADLLAEAGKAHHQVFIETDGFDPDWPLWYADYLHQKLGTLLNAQFSKCELIYLLVLLFTEQHQRAPGAGWPLYYSKFLTERYA